MQDFCWSLKYNLTAAEVEEMQITINGVTGLPEVDCFAEKIANFMEVNMKKLHIIQPLPDHYSHYLSYC